MNSINDVKYNKSKKEIILSNIIEIINNTNSYNLNTNLLLVNSYGGHTSIYSINNKNKHNEINNTIEFNEPTELDSILHIHRKQNNNNNNNCCCCCCIEYDKINNILYKGFSDGRIQRLQLKYIGKLFSY